MGMLYPLDDSKAICSRYRSCPSKGDKEHCSSQNSNCICFTFNKKDDKKRFRFKGYWRRYYRFKK